MSQEIMWSLLITFGAIAVAAVLDSVKHRRELHLSDEELTSARKQFDTLQKNHNKSISDLKNINLTEKTKLEDRISNLEKQLHTYTSGERDKKEKNLIAEQQLMDKLNDEVIP